MRYEQIVYKFSLNESSSSIQANDKITKKKKLLLVQQTQSHWHYKNRLSRIEFQFNTHTHRSVNQSIEKSG